MVELRKDLILGGDLAVLVELCLEPQRCAAKGFRCIHDGDRVQELYGKLLGYVGLNTCLGSELLHEFLEQMHSAPDLGRNKTRGDEIELGQKHRDRCEKEWE